jgi:hypothetical protein
VDAWAFPDPNGDPDVLILQAVASGGGGLGPRSSGDDP